MKACSSHLCACHVFTVVKVDILCPLVVIHVNEESLHGIIKVMLVVQYIGAESDLIIVWRVDSLHELVTGLKTDMVKTRQCHVVVHQ